MDALSSEDATGKVNEMLSNNTNLRNDVRNTIKNVFKSKAAKGLGWSRGNYDWVNGRPQMRPPAPMVEDPAPGTVPDPAIPDGPMEPGAPVIPEGPMPEVPEVPIIEFPL